MQIFLKFKCKTINITQISQIIKINIIMIMQMKIFLLIWIIKAQMLLFLMFSFSNLKCDKLDK